MALVPALGPISGIRTGPFAAVHLAVEHQLGRAQLRDRRGQPSEAGGVLNALPADGCPDS
jgi:hypothetical protein